jgi:hypothetical protein
MNYNLLVNNYSEDTPAIAVIKDVNLEKLDSFISTLELVLQEHYCGSNSVTFPNGFPDDVSSRPYPVFCVDFQVEDNNGDDLWEGQVEISCIAIYDCPLNDDVELDNLNMDCGVSNTRSKLLTND